MKRFRHLLEYLAVRAVLVIVRFMPHPVVHSLGSGIGLVFYALDVPHRRLAIRNLRAAFPLRSARECRRIARATFAHFGRLLTTLLKFSTMTPAQMLERIEFEGLEHARSAFAAGRGVLFYTGHFGFWELNALVHPLALPPLAVLARALDNPRLNALLERARTCTGNSVIYRKGAIRRVLRHLAANGGIALLIDQHIQSADAVIVDFFNRPAATTSALAALALRTGARVIPVLPSRSPADATGLCTSMRSSRHLPRRAAMRRRRSEGSRSAVRTCSRCTYADIRSSGCGCTGGGGTSSRQRRCRACFPPPPPTTADEPQMNADKRRCFSSMSSPRLTRGSILGSSPRTPLHHGSPGQARR